MYHAWPPEHVNTTTHRWSGTAERFRRLRCKECGRTFSENYGTPKRWFQRTPAMGAGLVSHRWTMDQLMAYPVITLMEVRWVIGTSMNVGISERNFQRLLELKKRSNADSVDEVIDWLLDFWFSRSGRKQNERNGPSLGYGFSE